MNIYLIRHGDPDYAADALTELGHKQAELLAAKIKKINFDEIYQSPYGRAQQTAAHSLSKWKKQALTFDWLRELCWGDFSGDAYSTASPWIINEDYVKNRHCYPTDEWKKIPEVQNDRIVSDVEERIAFFDEFLKTEGYEREGQLYKCVQPNNKNIVFFCHGGLITLLLSHLLNISFWQMISHIGPKVTSISKVSFSSEKGYCACQLEYYNNTDHLNEF